MLFHLFISNSNAIAQELDEKDINQLKFRHIGRINDLENHPTNNRIIYAGTAGGGVWKSNDGGTTFNPIFDEYCQSIGAVALDPNDPDNTIYVGTGETWTRNSISVGDGMYKSVDGGSNWTKLGFDSSEHISNIIVNPTNSKEIYVGVLGALWGDSEERGVFKTIDGGITWDKILYTDQTTGCADLTMDPNDSNILYASMWEFRRTGWSFQSGGKNSALHKSIDGGKTWNKIHTGFPEGDLGRLAVAVAPSDSNILYTVIEAEKAERKGLYRSDDAGANWKQLNNDFGITVRPFYFSRIVVDPKNPDVVVKGGLSGSISRDGGKTFKDLGNMHSDIHEMWIDPNNGDRMAVAGDGGISISQNRGKSWHRTFLPVAQLYHVTTDNNIPYNVLTNRQDGPSMKGPSRSRTGNWFGPGMIQSGMWREVGGGESGFATADPKNPDIIWSSASGFGPLGGIVTRYNEKSKQYRQLEVWPEFTAGSHAALLKYRFQWTFPLLISPHDNKTIYVTSQHVHKTTNDGQTWNVVSPDLTLNDKEKQGFSGGLTGDNISVEYANVIYAFDESPIQKGILWAGTNDGLVHISQDNGDTWTKTTFLDFPVDKYAFDDGLDLDNDGIINLIPNGNFEPHVYKTENFGKSWKKITSGIKDGNLSYTRFIKEDPNKKGLLYLGTENTLYISYDDGEKWNSMMSNLPPAPMYWIDIQEHFNDLVIGTYGRGIWILDDISPLQQMNKSVEEKDMHLFNSKPSYRFHNVTSSLQMFPEASTGSDPPSGASINYWLKEKQDQVEIIITNAANDTIKTIKKSGSKGINRIWWNFEGESTDKIILRTKPLYAEWVSLDKDRERKVPFSLTMMSPPGTYNIHLKVGENIMTQKLEVIKDPHSEGSMEDIILQNQLMKKIYDDVSLLDVSTLGRQKITTRFKIYAF